MMEEIQVKTYRIYYYKYYSTIAYKDIKANNAQQAIDKAKLKTIISVKEI